MANQHKNKVIYYGETLMDITPTTATAQTVLSPAIFFDKSGAQVTGTCTYDADTSDATADASEILSGETAYVNGNKITGSMPNRGSVSGAISDKATPYTIPAGYHDGGGTVSIDSTSAGLLIAGNIRENITILGVTGTMSGSEDVNAQSKTVTPTKLGSTVTPDSPTYNYLSSVTIAPVPYTETDNAQGGVTITIGA